MENALVEGLHGGGINLEGGNTYNGAILEAPPGMSMQRNLKTCCEGHLTHETEGP